MSLERRVSRSDNAHINQRSGKPNIVWLVYANQLGRYSAAGLCIVAKCGSTRPNLLGCFTGTRLKPEIFAEFVSGMTLFPSRKSVSFRGDERQ